MYNPISTYRIQFNKDFTFKDLKEIIPYLSDLGVRTLYASPIFAAVAGSTHGYDVINPLMINPEIGTEAELLEVSALLKNRGIGWLQDIVPNHMAFHPSNSWLMDVLENWDESPFFEMFDLNFPTLMDDKRLMIPFLGETLEEAIKAGSLTLQYADGRLSLSYADQHWPMSASSKAMLADLWRSSVPQSADVEQVNADPEMLQCLCDAQHYRLCHWQETEKQINYRRFFTVNGLICLRMEEPGVFERYHAFIVDLVHRGIFQGLRVDHVDGLADPGAYLQRLRQVAGEDTYIIVEKILEKNEEIPAQWPIQGNSGYDFLAWANNLMTNGESEAFFTVLYHDFIEKSLDVSALALEKKRTILTEHMNGELDHLLALFYASRLLSEEMKEAVDRSELRTGLAAFLVRMPVYRFYASDSSLDDTTRQHLRDLILSLPEEELSPVVREVFLKIFLADEPGAGSRVFLQRLMQFSGPLMAKGIEDTLMYTYNRFIVHAEVGDSPAVFGMSVGDFHARMLQRAAQNSLSINATATHDTKRGEDLRARLNVLSDIPDQWRELVLKLKALSFERFGVKLGLHVNDAYFIYQTLVGAMPFREEQDADLESRLEQYLEKALREAKKRSGWADPDVEYEDAAREFTHLLLNRRAAGAGLIRSFVSLLEPFAIVNSLTQIILKCTAPGVPDIYQGTELWDLSLVDPDNRRPVDYALRARLLHEVDAFPSIESLLSENRYGKVKLWLCARLLRLRARYPQLFAGGSYEPLSVSGDASGKFLCYLRRTQDAQIIVVLRLGLAASSLIGDGDAGRASEEYISMPSDMPRSWRNLMNNMEYTFDADIPLSALLSAIPFAVLIAES